MKDQNPIQFDVAAWRDQTGLRFMAKKPLRIAVAQSQVFTSVPRNNDEIRRLMLEANQQDAALIHFTEGALSGYTKSQIKDWAHVDWSELSRQQTLLAEEAANLGLWTVVGCNHRLSGTNRPHNSLFIISDQGQVLTRYDKRWCSNSEINDWYTPGTGLCVFEVAGWRFGCVLCIEIQFPEVFMEYARADVDCVLVSAYSDDVMYGIQAQGYAAAHNYWVSCSIPRNAAGALTSRLIGPSGHIQAACPEDTSSVVVCELNEEAPEWKIALQYAKPWRALARKGEIYAARKVNDPRSANKCSF